MLGIILGNGMMKYFRYYFQKPILSSIPKESRSFGGNFMSSIMIYYVSVKNRFFCMCASVVPSILYLLRTHYKNKYAFLCQDFRVSKQLVNTQNINICRAGQINNLRRKIIICVSHTYICIACIYTVMQDMRTFKSECYVYITCIFKCMINSCVHHLGLLM